MTGETGPPNAAVFGTRSFAAWVPTILEHRSFAIIGRRGRGWYYANAESDGRSGPRRQRFIAVLRERKAKDLPITAPPVPLLRPEIRAQYLLIALSDSAELPVVHRPSGTIDKVRDDYGKVSGWVFMIPHLDRGSARAKTVARRSFVREVRRRLFRFTATLPRDSLGNTTDLKGELWRLKGEAQRHGVIFLGGRFELYRSGEFHLQNLFPAVDDPLSHWTPSKDIQLARQLYYFVKEASHKHYHHDDDKDAILPLTQVVEGHENSWRRETLWALSRAVVEARRNDSLTGYREALGVLAYGDAFQSVLARVHVLADGSLDRSDLPEYDFAHARDSIQAMIEQRRTKEEGRLVFETMAVAISIGGIAIWIASLQSLSALREFIPSEERPIKPNVIAIELTKMTLEAPLEVFLLAILVASTYIFASRPYLLRASIVAHPFYVVRGFLLATAATIVGRRNSATAALDGYRTATAIVQAIALAAIVIVGWIFVQALDARSISDFIKRLSLETIARGLQQLFDTPLRWVMHRLGF